MADFSLQVGTHKTAVPQAFSASGDPVAFPEGSVFTWTSSDPSIIDVSDPAAASPEVTATTPGTVTLMLAVDESGFHHEATHTVEAVAAPSDTIDHVDFTLS